MKTVLLAGGLGTRLAEETTLRPKPMVEIGSHPILWHIMSLYAAYGHSEFLVALGYKAHFVKEYFLQYRSYLNDLSIDLGGGDVTVHPAGETSNESSWKLHLVDTGLKTMTGGRLLRLKRWLQDDETFMMTYGDGVSSVDIDRVLEFHRAHGKVATVTAVRPPARFGSIVFEGNKVLEFSEKPQTGEGWINGGFFVLNREIFDYLDDDQTIFERTPMERLAANGELMAYYHEGFWQCMDTLREKQLLEELWNSGCAPWKVWA